MQHQGTKDLYYGMWARERQKSFVSLKAGLCYEGFFCFFTVEEVGKACYDMLKTN